MVEAEGTLVGAVEEIVGTAVGEGEDLITPEQISKMTVVSTQLAMVMWPLHFCKILNYFEHDILVIRLDLERIEIFPI